LTRSGVRTTLSVPNTTGTIEEHPLKRCSSGAPIVDATPRDTCDAPADLDELCNEEACDVKCEVWQCAVWCKGAHRCCGGAGRRTRTDEQQPVYGTIA